MRTVGWPLAATDRVRMPPVCAATGQPAETWLEVPVRRFQAPGRYTLGALPLLGLFRPPLALLRLPVTRDAERRWRRASTLAWLGRWLVLAAAVALVGLVLALVLALHEEMNAWFATIILAVLVVPVVLGLTGLLLDPLGVVRVGEDVALSRASDAFTDSLVQGNPPGLVRTGPPRYGMGARR